MKVKTILSYSIYWIGLLFFGGVAFKLFWLAFTYAAIFFTMLARHFDDVVDLAKSNPATYILLIGAWAYFMLGGFNLCFNITIKCYDKIREQLKEGAQ